MGLLLRGPGEPGSSDSDGEATKTTWDDPDPLEKILWFPRIPKDIYNCVPSNFILRLCNSGFSFCFLKYPWVSCVSMYLLA